MLDEKMSYDEMYRESFDRIRNYLSRAIGSEEARDMAQEAFLKALAAFDGFEGRSSAYTWIYRIATNLLIDRKRRERIAVDRCGLRDRKLYSEPHGDYLSEEHRIVEEEMKECICGYIKALPIRYRSILLLREYESMSIADISRIMGISAENAKKTLARARKRLRESLKENCHFSHDDSNRLCCEKKMPELSPS